MTLTGNYCQAPAYARFTLSPFSYAKRTILRMPTLKNAKHELFVQNVMSGMSIYEAHENAGYKSDRRNAEAIRRRADISRRLDELLERREEIGRKSTERAIERLALTKEALAREFLPLTISNVSDYIRLDDGEPVVDFRLATREQMAALRSLEVHTYMDGKGDTAREVKKVKFALWPKVEAGMGIAKLFGWVIHKTEDVSRLEERLAQMSPEQRRQDAADIYRKARERLLEDQRSTGGGIGSAPIDVEAEMVEIEPDAGSDDVG